jgi:hypothetical protein
LVSSCNMDQPSPKRMRVDIRRQCGHGVDKKLCFNYDPPHLFRRDCFWAGITPRGRTQEDLERNGKKPMILGRLDVENGHASCRRSP